MVSPGSRGRALAVFSGAAAFILLGAWGRDLCGRARGVVCSAEDEKIIRDSVYPGLYGAKFDIQAGFGESPQVAPDRMKLRSAAGIPGIELLY